MLHYVNGERYEGHFFNDSKEGYGILHFNDGHRFEGQWKNNFAHGQVSQYANHSHSPSPHGHACMLWYAPVTEM